MVKVENGETIRLLTRRFLKMNRKRNRLAVLAVFLTALLFTTLFFGAVSMILTKRAMDMEIVGNHAHASVQNLTVEEGVRVAQVLAESKDIKAYGSSVRVGNAANEELGFRTVMRSGDGNMAKSIQCVPEKGRMPQYKNEVAVSSFVLDALQIPHRLGEEITLTCETNPVTGGKRTDTFLLCGYWKGDKNAVEQTVWVSKAYAEENCYPVTKEETEKGIMNGSGEYVLWYKNLWDYSGKTERLSKDAKLIREEAKFQMNPAYDILEEDAFSFSSLAVLIFLIFLAGYLIVYNIFNVSVKEDIRTYGLLKNVGTTGRQLKKLVRLQAFYLSLAGIPAGLIAGYAAGTFLADSLNTELEIYETEMSGVQTITSVHPLIFLSAGIFTILTVYLSSARACRIVEKVSPVEALRLSEGSKGAVGEGRRNISFSWRGMAGRNILRNWRGCLLVMLSVALSLFAVNCTAELVRGYQIEEYEKIYLNCDFRLDQVASNLYNTNFEGIDTNTKELLEKCPYSSKTGYVYYSEEYHEIEPGFEEIFKTGDQYIKKRWKETKKSGKIRIHLLGVNEDAFSKLEWKDSPCSWREFRNGESVIVDYPQRYGRDREESFYHAGDKFHMEYQSGKIRDYHVLGEAKMTYSLDYPYADDIYLTVIVPEEEYIACTGKDGAMYAMIDAKKDHKKNVDEYLEETIRKQCSVMNISSTLNMRKSFKKYVDKYYIIGGFLTIILAVIGIMNFSNTIAASVLSRKRELALLEAVGMTKKQIKKMLAAEGLVLLAGAFLIALIMILMGTETILAYTVGAAFFFHAQRIVLPCVVMTFLLLPAACVIPLWQFGKMEKESIVDRIRI